jgi:hypothetical protein
MSASEKLRVLVEEQALEGRFPDLPDGRERIVLAALPEIVALAKAAERSHDHRQALVGGICETCTALAALDEKLS